MILSFRRLPATIAILIAVLDQLTKYWVAATRPLHSQHVVIPGLLHLVHLRNTGGAWGLFQGRCGFLSIISIAVAIVLVACFDTLAEGRTERAYAITFILGGILGNLVDRLFRGYVVDFILFFFRTFHWPAFNLADSAISCGVAVFVVSSFLHPCEQTPEITE